MERNDVLLLLDKKRKGIDNTSFQRLSDITGYSKRQLIRLYKRIDEEGLDDETVENAITAIANADMLIIGGTSLTVYPASGLINYYRGNKLVLINRDETNFDRRANLVINDSLGKVFNSI